MTSDLSNLINEFKRRPIPEYMLDKAAKSGYICLCGNGSGTSGTGATLNKDRTRLLCGKQCGKANGSYSYIDVAAHYYNIDLTNFTEGVKELARREGIDIDIYSLATPLTSAKPVAQVKPTAPNAEELEQKRAAADYLNGSPESLREFLNSQGGYYRGLSFYTLNFLKWKFCENYKHTKNNFSFPAMLIPNDNGGLLARQIDGDAKSNLKPSGTSTLYLPKNPKFILAVEGAINGASILQALGTDLDFAIIAANGVGNKNLLISKILQLFPQKNIPVAIALDNDKAGTNAAADVLNSLKNASFTACTINITKTAGKDLNDVLNANNGTSELSKMLKDSIKFAKDEFDRIDAEKNKDLFGESESEFDLNQFDNNLDLREKFSDRQTGFNNLDAEIDAFLPGIYVIGGLPALGKTTFSIQLLRQLAQNGAHCIFCSFEMSKNSLHAKQISRAVYLIESNNGRDEVDKPLTATNILSKKFYNHKANFDKAREELRKENIPFYIWELDEIDIDKLLARIERICNKLDKPPIICLDYLQLLASNTEQTKAGIDTILRKLKIFQRATDTTFIIVSSLNRLNYNNEISFEAFKESGGIEYSADVIWGLQFLIDGERNTKTLKKAKQESPRKIQLQCLKNRFGANFDIGFLYYSAVDYFKPMDEFTYTEFTETSTENTEKTTTKKSKSKYKLDDDEELAEKG